MLAPEHFPDLFVIDVQQLGESGFELVQKIRYLSSWVGMLVIVSEEDEGAKTRAFNLGADNLIMRPFPDDELLAIVRRLARMLFGG